MTTKKKSSNILLVVVLLLAFLFQQCNNAEKKHQSHQSHNDMSVEANINHLVNSPNTTVLSRQATVKLSSQKDIKTLKAQGYIDFDKNRSQTVSARFGGRIEKLNVKYDLQYVKKGDKILDLYSPELNTYQEEHLFLLKSEGVTTLLIQSRQKLKLLGLTDNQISQLEKTKTFSQTISVYSPSDGYVLFNTEPKGNSASTISSTTLMNSMGMNEKSNAGKNFGSSNAQISEGIYVNKGETLFSVNDLRNVWAIVSVPSDSYSAITENSQVNISSEFLPDKQITGTIKLVEKTFEDSKQRFLRVRISLPNTNGELKINSLITAEIPLKGNENIQVPASAVYRTGLNSFVWLKTGTTPGGTGIFQLRKVSTGAVTNGMTTIIGGLAANQEIAEHAGSLTDSETYLNEK